MVYRKDAGLSGVCVCVCVRARTCARAESKFSPGAVNISCILSHFSRFPNERGRGVEVWYHRYQRMESVIAWTQVRIGEFRKFISGLSKKQLCLRFDILFLATLEFRCIFCYYSWLFITSMENMLIYLIVIAYNVKICKLQVVWGFRSVPFYLVLLMLSYLCPSPIPMSPSSPLYHLPLSWGMHSKIPHGCLELQMVPNSIQIIFFLYLYTHDTV